MSVVSRALRRTCTAFVLSVSPRNASSLLVPRIQSVMRNQHSRLFSSFQAPVPPQSKGEAVFSDIHVKKETGPTSQATIRNSSPDGVFVVNGASRGIGLQFVKTLFSTTKGTIVACCRDPSAVGLQSFVSTLPTEETNRIEVIRLDLEDQQSIEEAATEIKEKYKRVDMLLNVAGLLGDSKSTPGPERSISKMDRDWLEKTFSVNVFGPVMFSKELAPLMAQKRRSKKSEDLDIRPNAVIANLSARVGSVSDNSLGGWYSYRMSKSALNQATRTMSHELKRQSIWCIALHPGTTNTDLSKPFQKNVAEGRLFPVEFTVESLLGVINSMEDENSGGLYDWAGKAIPF